MATYVDFTFDHMKLTKPVLMQHLTTLQIPFLPSEPKTDLVIKLEKYAADIREADGANPKDYMDPAWHASTWTMPKLRQTLSQYGIHYGTTPAKPVLINIFMSNIDTIRARNGGVKAPEQEEEEVNDLMAGIQLGRGHNIAAQQSGRQAQAQAQHQWAQATTGPQSRNPYKAANATNAATATNARNGIASVRATTEPLPTASGTSQKSTTPGIATFALDDTEVDVPDHATTDAIMIAGVIQKMARAAAAKVLDEDFERAKDILQSAVNFITIHAI